MNIEQKKRQLWKMIEYETKKISIAFDYYGGCENCEHILCCKINSPNVRTNEIHKIAKFLGMKDKDFIKKYLQFINSEGSIGDVKNNCFINQLPCPFLDTNNKCKIYDVRPLSCKMFPFQIGLEHIVIDSVEICPIATLIDSEIHEYFETYIKKNIPKSEIEEGETILKKLSGLNDPEIKNRSDKIHEMTEKLGVGIEEQGYPNYVSRSLFNKFMRRRKIFF